MSPNLTGKNACYQPNKMSTKFKLETHSAWKHLGQFWETSFRIDLLHIKDIVEKYFYSVNWQRGTRIALSSHKHLHACKLPMVFAQAMGSNVSAVCGLWLWFPRENVQIPMATVFSVFFIQRFFQRNITEAILLLCKVLLRPNLSQYTLCDILAGNLHLLLNKNILCKLCA